MYGSIPRVSDMFEIFARHYLGITKDEKKVKQGETINGEYIENDSYSGYSSGSGDSCNLMKQNHLIASCKIKVRNGTWI